MRQLSVFVQSVVMMAIGLAIGVWLVAHWKISQPLGWAKKHVMISRTIGLYAGKSICTEKKVERIYFVSCGGFF